ncbi:MAG: hypothetical protein ACK4F9_06270 [Brevinematia bacterium]
MNSYSKDSGEISRELAYFYILAYSKLNNSIFGATRYNVQKQIRELCLNKDASSDSFYNVISIMLIYYATQTYPKRMQLKKGEFTKSLAKFLQENDIEKFSADLFFSTFDVQEIGNQTPAWFVQTINALRHIKPLKNIDKSLYILLRKVCSECAEQDEK